MQNRPPVLPSASAGTADLSGDPAETAQEAVNARLGRDLPIQPKGERGGAQGAERTRYGDWEVGGRCSDF